MRCRRRERLAYAAAAAALTIGAAGCGAIWWSMHKHRREPRSSVPPPVSASHALVPYVEPPLPAPAGRIASMQDPAAPSQPVRPRMLLWTLPLLTVLVAAFAAGVWIYREHRATREIEVAVGGVGVRAIPVMLANGCAGCHTIPGVPGAHGQVGPPLDSTLSSRLYLTGALPNNRENMIRWLRVSRELVPHTAMPSTGISEQEARDIAAYLYALR